MFVFTVESRVFKKPNLRRKETAFMGVSGGLSQDLMGESAVLVHFHRGWGLGADDLFRILYTIVVPMVCWPVTFCITQFLNRPVCLWPPLPVLSRETVMALCSQVCQDLCSGLLLLH